MDPVVAIILLMAFALLIALLALPVAALIVSIQTRRRFGRQLSDTNLHEPALLDEIRHLRERIDKLEFALAQQLNLRLKHHPRLLNRLESPKHRGPFY
jgi:hypothetical protein